jgi:hypothetical protein
MSVPLCVEWYLKIEKITKETVKECRKETVNQYRGTDETLVMQIEARRFAVLGRLFGH